MHIILFILIFLIAIFVFGLSIIGYILRAIFGLGRGNSSSRSKQPEYEHANDQRSYNPNTRNSVDDDEEEIFAENHVPRTRHKKIFTQDDGEYVDFEEIKEDR